MAAKKAQRKWLILSDKNIEADKKQQANKAYLTDKL